MIDIKQITRLIRYKVGDIDEVKYSKYDVLNALNECVRYVAQSNALMNSDFLETVKVYEEQEPGSFAFCGVPLPEDYATLVGITRLDGRKLRPTEITNIPSDVEYKITNERVYCGVPAFAMAYKKCLPTITEEDEEIDLPMFCSDAIVKTTSMILEQAETDILMQAVDDTTRAIVPRRRYVGAETKMPFIC